MTPEEKQLLIDVSRKLDDFLNIYYKENFPSKMVVFRELIVKNNVTLGKDTSKVALYGKTPVVQASGISAPSGGTVVDAESRTAITAILTALTDIGVLQ